MFSIHLVKKNLNRLALILRSGKKVAFTDYDETLKRTIKESSIESGSVTKMSKDLRSKLKQPDTVEVSEYKKQESFHSDKSSPEKLKSSRNWILENENEQPPMPIIILPIVDGKDIIPNEETVIHPDESAPLGHSQSSPIKKTEELTIEVVEEGQRGEVKPPSPKNWEI